MRRAIWAIAIAAAALATMNTSAGATNLIVNGDFQSGDNSGFSSEYTYESNGNSDNTACYPPGVYAIVTDPVNCHNAWYNFSPYGGETYMMAVNGAEDSSEVVWSETINVAPGTYDLSAWATGLYPVSPSELQFDVNGNPIGTLTLSSTVPDWLNFSQDFTTAGGDITISIYDLDTQYSGNDFGLDEISLTPVPEPLTLSLLGVGIAGAAALRRRRKSKVAQA